MKRAVRFAVLGPMFASILASAPAVAQEVTFAYKFEPGTSERYRVKLNQEVSMGQMEVSNLADMEVTVKCVSVADGKYAMELKFDKSDVSTTMMGNTSASPLGEQLAGQTISFTADASGGVTDVKPVGVFEEWAMAQQLVEPVLQGWYPHLPNKAMAVGGEWKQAGEKQVGAGGSESVTNASFKFKAMKKEKTRDVAVVEQTLDTTIGGTSATPMGVYSVAGSGTGKGEFLFDPSKSRVVKVKGKVDLNMDMTPQSGGEAMNMIVANHFERELLE
ncbi:MAG TPA: hypothetical protein VEC56_06615 [Candidatus Krumholzibacteria bacterium]|nr:hypothetical protein [Candidatus Krumholzibacteria bacterium]